MQVTQILLSSLLLIVFGSCKSKQPVPETTAPGAVKSVPEEGQVATKANVDPADADMPVGADSVYFSLERTACFGTCPAYKVTINTDGSAVYEGRRFAAREGRFVGKVDGLTMKALYDKAVAVGFFSMDDKYDRPVTDLPSTIIRVHANGKDKQVVGRVGPPQGFKDLAQEAERILAPVEWTHTGDLR